MGMLINLIVGAIVLTITIFVHRHTYGTGYVSGGRWEINYDDPAPSPRWAYIGAAIAAFIPIINIILFVLGGLAWGITYASNEIRFGNPPKWLKSIIDFLTKEI